jgi:hypothetical protein
MTYAKPNHLEFRREILQSRRKRAEGHLLLREAQEAEYRDRDKKPEDRKRPRLQPLIDRWQQEIAEIDDRMRELGVKNP